MKTDTICCYYITKCMTTTTTNIAKSLHEYLNRATLTACEVGVLFWEKLHNSWKYTLPLIEEPQVSHGHIFERDYTSTEVVFYGPTVCHAAVFHACKCSTACQWTTSPWKRQDDVIQIQCTKDDEVNSVSDWKLHRLETGNMWGYRQAFIAIMCLSLGTQGTW